MPTIEDTHENPTTAGMTFVSLHIKNFRALRDIQLPLSDFSCLIGENNSGKSSALQALLLVLPGSGSKATAEDFYDKAQPIRIALRIEGITANDLNRLANAHRSSVAKVIVDGAITLARVITWDGAKSQSNLKIEQLRPKNEQWQIENLKLIMSGKKGAALRTAVVAEIQELDAVLPDRALTHEVVENALNTLIDNLPLEMLVMIDSPIPVGIENGIKGLLPEPIYIEAVKDVADEVKTTDSATFGKLLSILLDEVKGQFDDIEKRFQAIQRQLSRVTDSETGKIVDERLDEVKRMEEIINNFVRESFPDVELKINVPVPKMRTILAGAEITADDGHESPVTEKGDGLKRAVAFAILRAYTALRSNGIKTTPHNGGTPRYWLLFEEPELYLYPRAQQQLFRALEFFAQEHLVLVTTHSPLFLDAEATRSFVKFRKTRLEGQKPHTQINPVDLRHIPDKKAFQLVCHENNNIGFFARKVVLVEGDSDAIVFHHLARLLGGKAWDAWEQNIKFARIEGKGNIKSYCDFFEKFQIPVHVIVDLDIVINGFDLLDTTSTARALKDKLLTAVSNHLNTIPATEMTQKQAKGFAKSNEAQALWVNAQHAHAEFDGSNESFKNLAQAVDEFFMLSRKDEKLETLKSAKGNIDRLKKDLLAELSKNRVHILSRGAVEAYYRPDGGSSDKVKNAIYFRSNCQTIEDFRTSSGDNAHDIESELHEMFSAIFAETQTQER